MAKYNVNFSCGHSDVVELFGPHKERYSRIDWLESKGLCPCCYKASRPREVMVQSLYKDGDQHTIVFTLSGETYSIKDQLKELGFCYSAGLGWHRRVKIQNEDDIVTAGFETCEMLKELGVYTLYATRHLMYAGVAKGLGVQETISDEMRSRLQRKIEKQSCTLPK